MAIRVGTRRKAKLLESLQAQVVDAIKAGLSLDDTLKRVTLAGAMQESCAYQALPDLCRNSFRHNFVEPAVARTYKEQKGGPLASEDSNVSRRSGRPISRQLPFAVRRPRTRSFPPIPICTPYLNRRLFGAEKTARNCREDVKQEASRER